MGVEVLKLAVDRAVLSPPPFLWCFSVEQEQSLSMVCVCVCVCVCDLVSEWFVRIPCNHKVSWDIVMENVSTHSLRWAGSFRTHFPMEVWKPFFVRPRFMAVSHVMLTTRVCSSDKRVCVGHPSVFPHPDCQSVNIQCSITVWCTFWESKWMWEIKMAFELN